MKRFLLINPHYPIGESPSPPLGLAFLGAALEEAGAEVQLLDLVVFPYSRKYLEEILSVFQPDFVGATAVTMSFYNAIRAIRDVKEIDPHIVTVMGGPHVTFCAEETLSRYPQLDVIVLGEGEQTLVELVNTDPSSKQWDGIAGIVYRRGSGIHRTPGKRPPLDVNTLPFPARRLLPLGRYRALNMPVSMTTSRGCPFKCIFCVGRKMVGARVRYRRPDYVVDELAYLSTLGFSQINIADDLFTANRDHCIAICDEIVRRGIRTKWSSFARVDTVSAEVLEKMRAAGCYCVSFGIETANAGIMKTIKKGISIDQVIEAVGMCKDAGILPTASFILGLPGETPETLRETLAFGERLEKMGVCFGYHLLAPFPGTAVRVEHERFGLRLLTDDWSEYHANRAIVETDSVSKAMLDEIVVKWENDYHTYLKEIETDIAAGRADSERAAILLNLERTVLFYDLMMQEVIETAGTWSDNGSAGLGSDPLKRLVSEVHKRIDHPLEKVDRALQEAVSGGHLLCERQGKGVRWHWVDGL